MRFNRYTLGLLLRLLLLLATTFVLAKIEFSQNYRATIIGLALLLLLQVWLLLRYLNRTDALLLRFLNSIRYDDFTEQFQVKGAGKTLQELASRLNEVMHKFREVRAEKEAQLQYMEMILQHIGTGIISYKFDGSVLLMNNAAKKMLQSGHIKAVAELEEAHPRLALGLQQAEQADHLLVPLQQQSGEQATLSVHIMELSLLGERIRLASLQNIQQELEDKEIEAWGKLIRVLTHEIMNSVTPISSLSASAYDEVHSFTDTPAEEVTLLREELQDIGQCLQTISRRSDGLIRFVEDFRNLTTISPPQLSRFSVQELLQEIKTLLREQFARHQVQLQVEAPAENLLLTADRSMVAQVLINLCKNALEAVQEQAQPCVCLKAWLDERSRTSIAVKDNGPGMTPEAINKVFIPFYTTKKTGSGIGLSLSRQIMRLHNGSIGVQSELGSGTTFLLRF